MSKPISGRTPAMQVRFTAAEFQRMIDAGAFDDMWVELVEGELERMPPPGNRQAFRQASLLATLATVLSLTLLRGEIGVAIRRSSGQA